ncbi:MAG: ADP-ribosylglycohydrolase family protein [Anaerolineae bacterium]
MKFHNAPDSRLEGALLALACGDALGAPAEFQSQAEVKRRWGTLQDMVGGGLWAPGEWTDDTGMTLAVAEGILENPDDPVDAIGRRFIEWRKTAKDVGTTIGAALNAYHGNWAEASRNTPQARAGMAAGNGALMRTLPVALAYADPDKMLRVSAQVSAMTHWDPQAEMCCAIYCWWIQELLDGAAMSKAWQAAIEMGKKLARAGNLVPGTPGTQPLPKNFWTRLEAVESKVYTDLQPSGYAGYVVDCLEAAAWACLKCNSLEEALIKLVNLAGEADTMAAVAGGAVGACWGAAAIPARWLDKLMAQPRIPETAMRLGHVRSHLVTYSQFGLPAFNADWVDERVMAGRNPLTARDVDFLADQGITHVLDLREPSEWSSPRSGQQALDEIERRKIPRANIRIADASGPGRGALDAAYDWMKQALADPQARVYVHCRAGIERTAVVLVAFYARAHRVSYRQALAELRGKRPALTPLQSQERAVKAWLGEV